MALAVYFHPEAMSADKYDEVIKKLEAAGAGTPPGRVHHSAFGSPESLMVYDIWASQEGLDAFLGTLVPILGEVGLDPGTPDVMPVHNLIR